MKKILAILVALSMLVCLTSCAKISVVVPNKSNPNNQQDNNPSNQVPDDFNNDFTDNNQDNSFDNNDAQNDNSQSGQLSDNPADWSTAQIVDYYKKAAGRTHNSVTSYQNMTMRKDSLKAPGINGTLLSFAEGVMATALSNIAFALSNVFG